METTRKKCGNWNVFRIAGWVVGGIALAVLLAFIFGYVVMWLWNWVMPTVFNLPEINYWMAFGIILLAKILFGGFGHGHPKDKKDDPPHKKEFIKHRFKNGHAPGFREFGKWKHYEEFWEEEGQDAFDRFVNRKKEQADKDSHPKDPE